MWGVVGVAGSMGVDLPEVGTPNRGDCRLGVRGDGEATSVREPAADDNGEFGSKISSDCPILRFGMKSRLSSLDANFGESVVVVMSVRLNANDNFVGRLSEHPRRLIALSSSVYLGR